MALHAVRMMLMGMCFHSFLKPGSGEGGGEGGGGGLGGKNGGGGENSAPRTPYCQSD